MWQTVHRDMNHMCEQYHLSSMYYWTYLRKGIEEVKRLWGKWLNWKLTADRNDEFYMKGHIPYTFGTH